MRLLLGSERRPPICEAHSVAMEANVIGHVGAEIRKRGDFGPKPTGDIQNRAVKAYVNAMKQLKVLPR